MDSTSLFTTSLYVFGRQTADAGTFPLSHAPALAALCRVVVFQFEIVFSAFSVFSVPPW
jgi:hypothetical protein